jgi:hypothetical protein
MVVKQPRIDIPFPQRGLDGRKIHAQETIVNKGRELRECWVLRAVP